MKAILLNGSPADDPTGERLRQVLTGELTARGWQVEHVLLRERKIGACAGDFFCWVRSPGICNVADDNRTLAAAVIASDLMVYLTPVTFGGYSSELKRIVDHQIQNIVPFFARVAGETHHQKRYRRYPDFLAIGWTERDDPQEQAVFRHLVARNAVNYYARTAVAGLVRTGQPDDELRRAARGWLDDLAAPHSSPAPELPGFAAGGSGAGAPRRAVLLVGSPRTKKSSSQSLGGYLFDQMAARGVQVETFYTHTSINSAERMQALLAAVDSADLLLLAFPLYVDSLPAPTIAVLERIADRRRGKPRTGQRFAAMANCGFPEAAHNRTALAICAAFARQVGFDWAGSLALGAGEGLVHGEPLAEAGGPAALFRQALDLAAEALAQGAPVPQQAVDLLAKPVVPPWMYRAMGWIGWRQQAKEYGVQKQLRRQAYQDGRTA